MSYCTIDDILTEIDRTTLIRLTDDEKAGTINTTLVQSIIDNGAALIDAHLQERYQLPLASTPAILKLYNIAIAKYRLYLRRENVPDAIKTDHASTITKLEAISRGDVSLGVAAIPELAAIRFNKTVADRVFLNPQGYFS